MSCTHLLKRPNGSCPFGCSDPEPMIVYAPGSISYMDGIDEGVIDVEDPEEAEANLYDLDREACLRSLAEMVRMAFNQQGVRPGVELEWGWHIDAVAFHVQQQLEDRGLALADRSYAMRAQNVLVNVPPRSLKTIILTIATAWAWLRWPTIKIMYLSANPRVAQDSARMFKDLVTGEWFQDTFRPPWELRGDQEALSDLGNSLGGTRAARGLDATVTGGGADWLIIDDPHDVRDTVSMVRTTVKGYASAVHNRINDPRTSIRTYIMQKVTRGDLSDYLLGITSLED